MGVFGLTGGSFFAEIRGGAYGMQ
ncbi:hypothetical protein SCFA_200004 [anaerobic digester metagenome]|uniref:Uncharacterized protein n=1 Tax=anaerobic digester metagenome TaxID=1263854 RepID=A0A485LYI1_9ZZZZ